MDHRDPPSGGAVDGDPHVLITRYVEGDGGLGVERVGPVAHRQDAGSRGWRRIIRIVGAHLRIQQGFPGLGGAPGVELQGEVRRRRGRQGSEGGVDTVALVGDEDFVRHPIANGSCEVDLE